MNGNDIKVLFIDDDEGWISIVSDYLCEVNNIKIISICNSAEAAFQIIDNYEVDIILLDVDLSILEYNGIDLALQLKTKTNAKIIMFTISESKDIVEKALFAGAADYAIKGEYKKTLLPIIYRAFYSSSADVITNVMRKNEIEKNLAALTKTERKVLERCCEGKKPEDIQKEFGYQPQSYWNCIGKIKKKFNVDTLNDIVTYIKSHL